MAEGPRRRKGMPPAPRVSSFHRGRTCAQEGKEDTRGHVFILKYKLSKLPLLDKVVPSYTSCDGGRVLFHYPT